EESHRREKEASNGRRGTDFKRVMRNKPIRPPPSSSPISLILGTRRPFGRCLEGMA
nr:hypothetical protein [Tanacetum cinerariifolium]